jgi:hypothetical protein
MARTGRTGPDSQPIAGASSSRPQPLLRDEPDTFTADIGLILAVQVNQVTNGVRILPPEYIHDLDPDSPDASWRQSYEAKRCWKTTIAYEQISGSIYLHPRIGPLFRRDPWNALPILAKPSGPPLDRLLAQNRPVLYEEGTHRIKATHRPPRLQMGPAPRVRPVIRPYAGHHPRRPPHRSLVALPRPHAVALLSWFSGLQLQGQELGSCICWQDSQQRAFSPAEYQASRLTSAS